LRFGLDGDFDRTILAREALLGAREEWDQRVRD
jgi:hypothetical protein